MVAGATASLTAIVFFAIHLPLRKKYTELSSTIATPLYKIERMDSEGETFLEMVTGSWDLHTDESPDSAWGTIAAATGFTNDLDGLLSFFTHKIQSYSYLNTRRNASEAAVAASLAVFAPASVDGIISVRDNLAFIRVADRAVLVYETIPAGLRTRTFIKPLPPTGLPRLSAPPQPAATPVSHADRASLP